MKDASSCGVSRSWRLDRSLPSVSNLCGHLVGGSHFERTGYGLQHMGKEEAGQGKARQGKLQLHNDLLLNNTITIIHNNLIYAIIRPRPILTLAFEGPHQSYIQRC